MRTSFIALAVAATLSAGLAQAESATYNVDPTHTFATFEIGHFGASTNRGRFDKKTGSITLDKAAKTGKVDVTFETASINTGTAAFDKHLQSPDLFDARAVPSNFLVQDGAQGVVTPTGFLAQALDAGAFEMVFFCAIEQVQGSMADGGHVLRGVIGSHA